MSFAPCGFEFGFEGELSSRTLMVGPRHIAIVPKARTTRNCQRCRSGPTAAKSS